MSANHDKQEGPSLYYYNELSSTNSHLREMMSSQHLEEMSVVMTGFQKSGRGQAGNTWESERGKNIMMSVLLYPRTIEIMKQFGISMVVSLAVVDVLHQWGIDQLAVKWPNDIYVRDNKVAGILIEHSIMGPTLSDSIVGIGLNVNQQQFLSDAPNPVSMSQLLGKELSLGEVFESLMGSLSTRYNQLLHDGDEELKSEYTSLLWRADGVVHGFKDENGFFDATIAGVDEIGRLVLQTSDHQQRVYGFKEVEYIK